MKGRNIIALLLCAGLCGGVRASDPIGVYALVDRVVLEPEEASPDRIQIWGAFSLAGKPGTGDSYSVPVRGFLDYTLQEGLEKVSRAEWADLAKIAGTGQCVGFGSRYFEPPPRIRSSAEDPVDPDLYAVNFGLVKAACDSDFPPLRDLASMPVPVSPLDGSRFNEPGPLTLEVRGIQAADRPDARYIFEIEDRSGHLERSPEIAPLEKRASWTPLLAARAGESYAWRCFAVDGPWQGPVAGATFELRFLRGDLNGDQVADLSDAVALLDHLFLDGLPPRPPDAGDFNGDGDTDISDSIYLLFYLYVGGPAPPAPFPNPGLLPPGA